MNSFTNDDLANLTYQDLGLHIIGKRIVYLPVTTSTNDVARCAAKDGAAEGTVVFTGRQTAGRGKMSRNWISPEGVLAASFILRPSTSALSRLIMVASLAVAHAITDVTNLETQIKWPNDVLIGEKKVCGILIENSWKGRRLDYAIIGIGINVNLAETSYPEIAGTATSLSIELGKPVSLLEMAKALLKEMDIFYIVPDVYSEWRIRLINLNKTITVKSGQSVIEGKAESVDSDGSLNVRTKDGMLIKITNGDTILQTEGQSG